MKRIVNSIELEVSDQLEEFTIEQKPSSNVEYFGNSFTQVFVQFRNGSTYIYEDVEAGTIADMFTAESIGSFVSKNIVKKYSFKHYSERMVRRFPVAQK